MKQMILIAVLLVSIVQSKYIDYCGIEPLECAFHVFDIGQNDPYDTYTCFIQPFKYNGAEGLFEPYGTQEQYAPTTVNETAIRCELNGTQSGNVTLVNGKGAALESAFIYPTMCFEKCGADLSCNVARGFKESEIPMYGFKVKITYGECFVDNVCHPNFVFNPANPLLWCDTYNTKGWTEHSYRGGFWMHASSVVHISGTGRITRASVPEVAGTEGLDLTADGAYYDVNKYHRFTVETDFKIYVRFGPKLITETETFFEFPSMLKIQRMPDKAIIAEYTFLDSEANHVIKVVPLTRDANENEKNESSWLQLIGRRMQVKFNINKRQETAKWNQDDWNMIGLHYSHIDGVTTLKWYLNGKDVEVDHGNTTGLYLRADRGPILSHGQFSCFESAATGGEIYDFYFAEHDLTTCMKQYKEDQLKAEPEARSSECERQYYNNLG